MLLLLAEVGVRLFHVADVPLYRADPVLGYAVRPNQHGRFLRANWVFNDRGFGMAGPCDIARSVVLVGDSIVTGVSAIDQPRRLGPRLAARLGRPVCPLGAVSWTLTNELQALAADRTLRAAETLVIVSNSEDFGLPSVWLSELTHPRTRPVSQLAWVAWRRFGPPAPATSIAPTPAAAALWRPLLARFLDSRRERLLWVLYPARREVGGTTITFDPLLRQLTGRAVVLDLRRDPRWTTALYRDEMHPTDAGNAELARLIAERLRDAQTRR